MDLEVGVIGAGLNVSLSDGRRRRGDPRLLSPGISVSFSFADSVLRLPVVRRLRGDSQLTLSIGRGDLVTCANLRWNLKREYSYTTTIP